MKRRTFLQSTAGAGTGIGLAAAAPLAAAQAAPATASQNPAAAMVAPPDPRSLLRVTDMGEKRGEMLYRKLGTTGEMVSVIGVGGSHIGKPPVDAPMAVKLLHTALDRGINFLDNSWDYNGGQSEIRMGTALSQGGYRQKAFLMTKIDGRTKQSAMDQLNESLKRMKVDHIDLVQHHEILRFDDPDRIFNTGGAMEALVEAKQAGKLRYIGFTGHKDPRIHLHMLAVAQEHGFHFDTLQMPLNVMDAHFRSFSHLVVPEAVRQGIGILGMKSFGDGVLLKSGVALKPIDYLHYSLNLPTSTVITGIDSMKILDQAFEAVRSWKPMDADQVAALLEKTSQQAAQGRFELFKTTNYFDTTAKHPDFMGGLTDEVQSLAPGPSA